MMIKLMQMKAIKNFLNTPFSGFVVMVGFLLPGVVTWIEAGPTPALLYFSFVFICMGGTMCFYDY